LIELKKAGKIPQVTHIIYFTDIDPPEYDEIEAQTALNLTLVSYESIVKEDTKGEEVKFDEVTRDTVYTLSYTSGTTGLPKGVMITHGNYASNIGAMTQFDSEFTVSDQDVYLSYLPLAHVIERMLLLSALSYKWLFGFYQGDVLKLKDDLAVLRPTIFASVPRLYNKFYDAMQQKISEVTGFKRGLLDSGVNAKLQNLATTGKVTHGFYDFCIFKKFREVLGGRVRVMITGSAPISKEVLAFLKVAFCCQIHEGYG
jgi:long-chain acyl-CoA synthetase